MDTVYTGCVKIFLLQYKLSLSNSDSADLWLARLLSLNWEFAQVLKRNKETEWGKHVSL